MSAHAKCLFLKWLLWILGGLAGILPVYAHSEPLGPASRNTGLVISEIMYSQTPSSAGTNLDYLEIYNSNPWPEDISGYFLTGSASITFPPDTIIPGHGLLLLAPDCDAVDR